MQDPATTEVPAYLLPRRAQAPGRQDDARAALQALSTVVPEAETARARRRQVLDRLLLAKRLSDRRHYDAKNQVLRGLMAEQPDGFVIDEDDGFQPYVGYTHLATGFRIHGPRHLKKRAEEWARFPVELRQRADILLEESWQAALKNLPLAAADAALYNG